MTPLGQPRTPAVCEAAEADGFFFSGIAPLYLDDGDALRLQYLGVELDTSLLQIENPFARAARLRGRQARTSRRARMSPAAAPPGFQ